MKSPQNTKSHTVKRKISPLVIVTGAVVILVALFWGGIMLYSMLSSKSSGNYAQDTAKPLEDALVKAGAVKQCSRGDTGRGSDNDAPNYMAVFEVPDNRDGATRLLETVASENGYQLYDNSASVNAGDNKLYQDKPGKRSPYSDLNEGDVKLFVTVFGSSTYNGVGGQFCGVTKRDNPPTDKTTIDITVDLPAFKR